MPTKLENLTYKYRELLLSRNLCINSRIETVRELTQLMGCSHVTAAKIIKNLAAEGLLQSVPGKGNFFKQTPRKKFKIGCASHMPSPFLDPLLREATDAMLDILESAPNAEVFVIRHRTLQNPAVAEKMLKEFDGLIVSHSYLDSVTIPVLRKFNKPIVLTQYIGIEEQLSVSQIIPDFSTALEEFCAKVDISSYKKIVLLGVDHSNSEITCNQIVNFFQQLPEQIPLEILNISEGGNEASMLCGYNFMESLDPEKEKDTLFITISGYIARGMYEYSLKHGFLPDILSVDNLDGHEKNTDRDGFFTAIDRAMTRCYVESAKLLLDKLESGSDCHTILKVPTEIIFRKSIKDTKFRKENPK